MFITDLLAAFVDVEIVSATLTSFEGTFNGMEKELCMAKYTCQDTDSIWALMRH